MAIKKLGKELLIKMYGTMLKIRTFEETIAKTFRAGDLEGFLHPCVGEEATATGVCLNLNIDDYITTNHRGHGHMIAKGADVNKMAAELYGKSTGYCRGKSGSMHIADIDVGVLGANGIVAAGIPIATGAGYSIKLRNTSQVAVSFFGDGATTQGAFHEAVNMAAAWKLPVIYIIENNNYLVGTRYERVCNIKNLSDLSNSYNIPGVSIDGNNVIEVYKAANKAVNNARLGKGPAIIECKTYRWSGHHLLESEDIPYRPKEEIESWKKKCPIKKFENLLLKEDIIDKSNINKMRKEIQKLMDEAIKFAEASPSTKPEEALEDVFAE
jgi:TPP-dependent pyruvate/acetoin dehydrogenase alpha subunit